jgi:type IV pilus assembly protein PilA
MAINGQHQRGFTLIELMIVVAIIGILAAIAIPNFLRYQAQSRQAEARLILSGIFVAEASFYGEQSRFSNFGDIGFALAGTSNRYAYRAHGTDTTGADTGVVVMNAGTGTTENENTVVASAASAGGFTATAVANLDNDVTIDMWHVNDRKQNLQTADSNDVTT